MKLSILSVAALSLTAAALPNPHARHQHHRRELVVRTVTEVVTTSEPAAVVYVNERREPQWTWWHSPSGNPYPHHTHHHTQTTIVTTATSPPLSSPASPTGSAPAPSYTAPSGGHGHGFSGHGISYDPYDSSGGCKTQSDINEDFDRFSGYQRVRIYGTDCSQIPWVMSAARAKGMHVFLGVYDIDAAASETQELIDAAKSDWGMVDAVSIGNEAVNSGNSTVPEVVAAVKSSRSALKAAGYRGPVVTVDTWDQLLKTPELCQVSDFAAANAHAFYDSTCSAPGAGAYVANISKQVQNACGGKTTVITESGWPSRGESNGQAVPSEQNQRLAINSLKSSMPDNLVVFEAYNDLWKSPGDYDAEQYWGIFGDSSS